ncbi:hypothetical protein ALON55S_07451 [Alishewanella longhuensis]
MEKTLVIQRYNPEHDQTPSQQSYQVPFDNSTSVLDALLYIQQSFRSQSSISLVLSDGHLRLVQCNG